MLPLGAVSPRSGSPRARRYPSDTTEAQWALLEPLLPDPAWLAGRGGRPETHCRRQIVDAIFYLVDNDIKWRALPADSPPWSTVYNYLAAWGAAGVTQQVLDGLRDRVRLREGRTAELSAGIIDSQSVRAAETAGLVDLAADVGQGDESWLYRPIRRGTSSVCVRAAALIGGRAPGSLPMSRPASLTAVAT